MARKGLIVDARATIRSFRTLEGSIQEELQKHLNESGKQLRREVKSRAPYRTGELKSSISRRTNREKTEVQVHARARHARFVERGAQRGSRRIPAQPFMAPAMEAVAPGFLRGVEEAVSRSVRKAMVHGR